MTDQQATAGWYPDASNDMRWWDGVQWTEKVQGSERPDGTASSAMPQPPATPVAGTPKRMQTSGPSSPFYKKKWVVGVAAGLVGLILGAAAAGSASVEDSSEYKALSSKFETLEDERDSLTDARDSLTEELAPLKDAVAAVDDREAALDSREQTLKDDESQVLADAKAVAKREKKAGIVEKDIESNTVAGDGIYEVGKDIKPGMYKTKGGAQCYYAVLRDTDGGIDSIVDNNNISGPGILTVADGQFLELSGCSDWVKQ